MRPTETLIFILAVGAALLIGLTSLMPAGVYSSAGWHAFWAAAAAALTFGIIKGHLWRDIPAFIMHISFLCMIAGGFCTSTLSRRGTLHLLPSQTADSFTAADGKTEMLPCAVTLLSFAQEHYPGMTFPRDFRTELLTASGDTLRISMNHIGRMDSYRIYQTSFDEQGGTILTVTHDPAGIAVTYAGFLLFAIGGVLWLLRKAADRRPGRKTIAACIAMAFMAIGSGEAYAVPAVDARLADSLASRQVLFNGETVSFTSFSTRLTYKLTGRDRVAQLTPEAFVASLIKYKEDWSNVPFIKVKSKSLREALSIEGKYAAVTDLYDEEGNYIPESLYEGGAGELDKDIIALDERLALLIDLWKGELFTPLPADPQPLRSKASIKAEILYWRINPLRIAFITVIVTMAVIHLAFLLGKKIPAFPLTAAAGAVGIAAYGWLWLISGSAPLSGTADIMEMVGVCVVLLCCVAAWRRESGLLIALGMAAAAFLLLVAMLGMKDPVLSPVMPVLASPWLSVHVSLVMLAYAVLGFTLPVSVTALAVPGQRDRLTSLALSLLAPGVFLLGLGIITGSMWANVSWGRYWAWDPKETWSLVTLMLYSIPLHRYFRMRRRPLFCCIYLILAFSSIIMTYFGVNLLPSLHAYN